MRQGQVGLSDQYLSMKVLISGHRKHKLVCYNETWIKNAIYECVTKQVELGMALGYSGMASGVDLWFCEACIDLRVPYIACPPFEGQEQTMEAKDQELRKYCLEQASQIHHVKNSTMVEKCTHGIIVFDGNKGGTHNVFQQLLEKKKPFLWINPISEKIWNCE